MLQLKKSYGLERKIEMSKKSLRYIVGILVVIMVSVLALGGCKKNKDKDKENTGVEGGLQVEESGEGDSIDFEDFVSDEEDDKKDTDNDGTPDKKDDDDDNDGVVDDKDDDDDNDGTPDKKDPDHPSNAGTGDNKEDNKDDDKDDDKDNDKDNVTDDEETGWSPFF